MQPRVAGGEVEVEVASSSGWEGHALHVDKHRRHVHVRVRECRLYGYGRCLLWLEGMRVNGKRLR